MAKIGKKAQSGEEYLATVGLVAIIIVGIGAGLFFLFSSDAGTTTFTSSMAMKIIVVSTKSNEKNAEIKLQNGTGGKITLVKISSKEFSDCNAGNATLPAEVPAGNYFTINASTKNGWNGTIIIEFKDFSDEKKSFSIIAKGKTKRTRQ